jgi:ABC-type transport system involved in cytochrome c biogenesis permease subunit
MNAEQIWLYGGACCYLAGAYLSLLEVLRRRPYAGWVQLLLLAGAASIGAAIAERWVELGHGPFLSMYEILVSSLFSLGALYGLAHWRFPEIRAGAPVALAVILVLLLWIGVVERDSLPLPPTYETPWLWAHVLTGKLFLGACLVAASLALLVLLPTAWRASLMGVWPLPAQTMDLLVWRWLILAFLCHSAMLVAGAVWAQDAWGRYWDWDPLETWAFATWLVMAAGLHARAAFRLHSRTGSAIVMVTFVLAFLTFFGVPFISLAPHQGAV